MSPRKEPAEPDAAPLPTPEEVARWHAEGRIAAAVIYPIPPLRDPGGRSALAPPDEIAPTPGWAAPATRSGVQLRIGSRLIGTVTGPTVIGRTPSAPGADAIGVDDTGRSVSRNHLRLELDVRGGLIACDLDSSNGTEQVGADGARLTFVPGKWYPIAPGDTIVIGDVALEVG